MTLKEEIHRLIDVLPEKELPTVRRFVQYVRLLHEDPVFRALLEAPLDDEPETPKEAAAVRAARRALKRGDVVADADLARELGL
ncbi:MAG: hypothetical protein Q7T26_03885 [Dehalococcoidia bacterium]|nr:hypothetical protein [Dehalococcoidia bacterium]